MIRLGADTVVYQGKGGGCIRRYTAAAVPPLGFVTPTPRYHVLRWALVRALADDTTLIRYHMRRLGLGGGQCPTNLMFEPDRKCAEVSD